MKNNNDIESFLRENRPQVEDNPAFLLEVQQKMRAVEGIKSEVDRQRNYGRTALVCSLVLGMLAGALAMLLAYMYPVDTEAISDGVISAIRLQAYDIRICLRWWLLIFTNFVILRE